MNAVLVSRYYRSQTDRLQAIKKAATGHMFGSASLTAATLRKAAAVVFYGSHNNLQSGPKADQIVHSISRDLFR
jgi:hypothetical protein